MGREEAWGVGSNRLRSIGSVSEELFVLLPDGGGPVRTVGRLNTTPANESASEPTMVLGAPTLLLSHSSSKSTSLPTGG